MKKNLLLLLVMMVSAVSSAQFTVWEDDFDDAEASDWILLDQDGNGSNWHPRKNIRFDTNTGLIANGTYNILGTYNIDLTTGSAITTLENNLAISPVIDLSFYAGKVSLVINAQPSIYDANQDLYVYGSTSTDPASFVQIGKITLERATAEDIEFKNYTLDISQFLGQTNLYIALGNNKEYNFIGYEIDKISVSAESLIGLGLEDNEPISQVCKLNQNPVQDYLDLDLGAQFQSDETTLKIYNTNGALVKETLYKKDDVSVSELRQGVYFLLVADKSITRKLKFIKK
ncbi:T9SS-dependent choice-of-anchor J family protein [Flavobacterium hercynium]|uniref:Secretion system C-terminal sorting domain-containing protein n=1 Tax=Flavobacterium hercynium TaxID=387094 RepID=A0A226H6U2_9FLAO|nr:T9SS type A sorting domain-containing protein [Flavobacterium hercynium]OXA90029.1 hypothetical protein B0A66_13575 [Flavobacterium hercynium]SMP14464.1 Por secretion system C-terminal sorting domain-containing protein [Flavobacterium hercynium]